MRVFFLVAHPFGEPSNPEETISDPFATLEAAEDALEAHTLNHGVPARVAVLAEVVEPIAYVVTRDLRTVEPDGVGRHLLAFKKAAHVAGLIQMAGVPGEFDVYGLVPVGDS